MEHDNALKELLAEGAGAFGVSLDDRQCGQFFRYMELLKEWNQKFNLTAITEDRDIVIKHFIDSISIMPFIGNVSASLIDVGSGAGFPGIPVKIAAAGISVTLLDSLDKRVGFMKTVAESLGLQGITAIHARAEDGANDRRYRESFDFAAARAVAELPVLLEYCLPFVRPGGCFIAMKGSYAEEISASKKALGLLGGEIEEVREILLPYSDMRRSIIKIRKFRHTPTKYPRKAGKPSKTPLV